MNRKGLRLAACSAAIAAVSLLALPGTSQAFQTIRIEGGTLFITGDVGKTPDEVTIRFDSIKNEYVIGHDIDMLIPPPGCTFEGQGPPYNILHCPAKGIARIRVDLGSDRDKLKFENIIERFAPTLGGPQSYVPIELISVEVNTGPGNDFFDGTGALFEGPAVPRPGSAAISAGNPAAQSIDMGPGVDTVSLVGGQNTVVFGGSGKLAVSGGTNNVTIGEGNSSLTITGGANAIALGTGNAKAAISDGTNAITFGAGNSKVTATGGSNSVNFGDGNSVYLGGSGPDVVTFGAGNNTFAGGAGDDAALLGAGNDTGGGGAGTDTISGGSGKDTDRGGSGNDKLFGGSGNDHLYGGPDFDVLKGGAGHRDFCLVGKFGSMFGCEKP